MNCERKHAAGTTPACSITNGSHTEIRVHAADLDGDQRINVRNQKEQCAATVSGQQLIDRSE